LTWYHFCANMVGSPAIKLNARIDDIISV